MVIAVYLKGPLADTQYKDETYFYGNNKNINRQRAHH